MASSRMIADTAQLPIVIPLLCVTGCFGRGNELAARPDARLYLIGQPLHFVPMAVMDFFRYKRPSIDRVVDKIQPNLRRIGYIGKYTSQPRQIAYGRPEANV